ncbi:hypothetical protein NEF87_002398 [Candidatus Lokiarchaeum ossiferum]|uniref:Uncharacterized protein n=1 Tax=Candidatus Lokiarchaeum ossiferum TaxID=2951803 RepID=A0ABY6HRY7_9ARCH|nr:hypothetical protein NEF87_002398 [Candidatus Lokiarchaeum sp. B-35]
MIFDFIVLKNGLPIVTINLHPNRGVCQDNQKFTLVSGFFQAITSFADSIESLGTVNELQMTDIMFSFQRKIIGEKEEILFILSSTNDVSKPLRKVIIEESSSTFLHMFRQNLTKKWNGNVTPFKTYEPVFKEILEAIMNLEKTQFEEPDLSGETRIISKEKLSQLYHNLPIEPIVPSVLVNKTKTTTIPTVSNRFQRYQTLQQIQTQSNQAHNIYSSYLTSKPKQKFVGTFHPSRREPVPSSSDAPKQIQPMVSLVAPTIDSGIIGQNLGGSSISTIPAVPARRQITQEEFLKPANYMSYIQPQIQSEAMYMNREDTPNANLLHTSIFDLTPTKLRITAGTFRDQSTEEWMKILIVAIDGRKSISQLAQQLDAAPMDILQACQILVKKNLIQFKK